MSLTPGLDNEKQQQRKIAKTMILQAYYGYTEQCFPGEQQVVLTATLWNRNCANAIKISYIYYESKNSDKI